jgi:hypothetical protein
VQLKLGAVILALLVLAVFLAGWLPKPYNVIALAVAAAVVISVWVWPLFESRRRR